MGAIYKRGKTWWIKYYRNGRPMRESTGSPKETIARTLLRQREGDVSRGLPITTQTNRVTFEEATADVVNDYKVNGKRSLSDVERRIKKHLTPFFQGRRLAAITTADVRRYVDARQTEQAANAQINRELAVLKRSFTLAMQANKLMFKPHIPMLREDNVRTGFFEPEQFAGVRAHLPEFLRPVVTVAYITGWRIPSEVLSLQWRQVDFKAGIIRLDAGTTKNGEGRVFPMTVELRATLNAQLEHTNAVRREKGIICPWVFHRDGAAIKTFRRSWTAACKAAGCPGRIPHDFRRTAVRNLVRAGVPERVAMTMTGHKTRSVFERYNIVSESDLMGAAQRLDAAAAGTIWAQSPPIPSFPASGEAAK